MTGSWEEELAQRYNRSHSAGGPPPPRPSTGGMATDPRPIDRRSLVPPFLEKLESAFSESIDRFNKAASDKVKSSGLKKGASGKTFEIQFGARSFTFEDSGRAFIRIWRKEGDAGPDEFAFVGPHPDDMRFRGWIEKEARSFKTGLTPVDERAVVRKYLTLLVGSS
jgi:hypothetical protein